MEKNKYFTVNRVVLIGVLSAMVFVLTKFISIPIPSTARTTVPAPRIQTIFRLELYMIIMIAAVRNMISAVPSS